MITKIKAVAAALIAIAAIITSNAAQAADRIPDELLGCWKYVESASASATRTRSTVGSIPKTVRARC